MYDVLSPILLHHISKNTGSACPFLYVIINALARMNLV